MEQNWKIETRALEDLIASIKLMLPDPFKPPELTGIVMNDAWSASLRCFLFVAGFPSREKLSKYTKSELFSLAQNTVERYENEHGEIKIEWS